MFVFGESFHHLHNVFDTVASFVDILTDESFWTVFFGQRGLAVIKRYIANDAIFVGLFLSLGPTLLSMFQTFSTRFENFVTQLLYISIEINDDEAIYHPVYTFVKENFNDIKSFKHVNGVTHYDTVQDKTTSCEEKTLRLNLIPQRGCLQVVKYKGFKLWINRDNYSPWDKSGGRSGGDTEELLEALSGTHQHLVISMRSRNLRLLQSIIQEWLDEYYEKKSGQLIVYKYKCDRWGGLNWDELCSKEPRAFNSVVLKEHQKEEVLEDLMTFRTQKQWYIKTGIPYRRGYLLYGPPGTGKTSFIQSLASKVHMNVALISLTTAMTDDDFVQALVEAPKNSIVVMEDIDHCTINDGEVEDSKKSEKRVTATGLLNALDGVFSPEGSLVFLTCNDMAKLTPALLRPGRVDAKVHFGFSDRYQTESMFWRFFADENGNKDPELQEIVQKLLDMIPNDQVSTAELQNLFMSHAMILNSRRKVRSISMTGTDDHTLASSSGGRDEHSAKLKFFHQLLDSIPAFLQRVEADREQAKQHAARKGRKSTTRNDDAKDGGD
ncbi:P-loop containing nucleoside triphosphate hydrolase protein [Zychaea mexicana]|uniref:P-loop containing nucleoside triphosphate hydrolase protein n=1 Tax=Zychaea mexicana TaxID=64656 RepID=UPI0022FDD6F9|nr:P-loop containing nucleoside triphosphate hydrolase protein [Zychaea mexicana]KAI9492087.1 P-loop containing nucleoside triphosphate hydrolase protein [Zychaea mexicana]